MATIIPKKLEKANTIYPDDNGILYSRGEYSGDYYRLPLPKITVYGRSPLIGLMIADRFNNMVLPKSPKQGMDYNRALKDSKLPELEFLDSIAMKNLQALDDSVVARILRGDYIAANLAKEENKYVNCIGTTGCINTVASTYADMFGPEYLYKSNHDLYNKTNAGESPYEFVIKDLPYQEQFKDDPDNPGHRLIDRITTGNIISGIDYNPNTGKPDGGHARIVLNVLRDKFGRITNITTGEDAGGMYGPEHMVKQDWFIWEGDSNPTPFDHGFTQVYRMKNIKDAENYIKNHKEEVKYAKKKLKKKSFGGIIYRLIPKKSWY